MLGSDRNTGALISGRARLRQAIGDVLGTPLGSRIMRPEYGSKLPRLVDAPDNAETIGQIYVATVVALARWVPEFVVDLIDYARPAPGVILLTLTGHEADGSALVLADLEVGR